MLDSEGLGVSSDFGSNDERDEVYELEEVAVTSQLGDLELDYELYHNLDELVIASQVGDLQKVNTFLSIPAVKARAAKWHNKALSLAAYYGHHLIVASLLTSPSVAALAAADDNWILRQAISSGQYLAVEALLQNAAVKEKAATEWVNQALIDAAETNYLAVINPDLFKGKNYLAVVNVLLAVPGVKANAPGSLIWVARQGDITKVYALLEFDGIKENAHAMDNLALRYAAENGHFYVVKILLANPAVRENATAENNYAYKMAKKNGHQRVVDLLLAIPAVKALAEKDPVEEPPKSPLLLSGALSNNQQQTAAPVLNQNMMRFRFSTKRR